MRTANQWNRWNLIQEKLKGVSFTFSSRSMSHMSALMFQIAYIFGLNLKAAQHIHTVWPRQTQPLPARRYGLIFLRVSPEPSGAAVETRPDMTVSGREKKGHQHGRLLLQLEVAWAAACYVALFVLCSLCYSNSLYGELVHDDVWAIVNNPDVRPGSSLRNIFRNDFWGKRMADNTSHKSYRPLCILTFK